MASNDFPFVRVGRAGKLQFFCPLCKYQQSTSTIQRVTLKHHAQISVGTIAFTMLMFPLFGWNGLLLYLVFWAAFEFFYRLRKRQALVCESCGFDPFLYKQDVFRARTALKQHWQERIEKENLFANLKLKNYQTARVKAEVPTDAPLNVDDMRANPSSPAAKSP